MKCFIKNTSILCLIKHVNMKNVNYENHRKKKHFQTLSAFKNMIFCNVLKTKIFVHSMHFNRKPILIRFSIFKRHPIIYSNLALIM
jgi:hypothetical protein